jgi:hypothetical protein
MFLVNRKAAQPMPDTHDTKVTKPQALAAPREPAEGEVLRARPVKEKIDHAALSREFMARFPKIRAALAK